MPALWCGPPPVGRACAQEGGRSPRSTWSGPQLGAEKAAQESSGPYETQSLGQLKMPSVRTLGSWMGVVGINENREAKPGYFWQKLDARDKLGKKAIE